MVLIVDEVLRFVIGPSLSCGLADILGPLACGYLWDQGVVFGFHVVLPPFIFTMLLVRRHTHGIALGLASVNRAELHVETY